MALEVKLVGRHAVDRIWFGIKHDAALVRLCAVATATARVAIIAFGEMVRILGTLLLWLVGLQPPTINELNTPAIVSVKMPAPTSPYPAWLDTEDDIWHLTDTTYDELTRMAV